MFCGICGASPSVRPTAPEIQPQRSVARTDDHQSGLHEAPAVKSSSQGLASTTERQVSHAATSTSSSAQVSTASRPNSIFAFATLSLARSRFNALASNRRSSQGGAGALDATTEAQVHVAHVSALVNACNRHGGLHFLHEAGLRGTGLTNSAAFHEFCRARLGIRDPGIARTAVQLAGGGGGDSIHVAKLVAALRTTAAAPLAARPSAAFSASLVSGACPSEASSDCDTASVWHSRSVDDLAELLSMERDELHMLLQRHGFGFDDPAARQEVQALIRSIVHMDTSQLKLPQGLHAPHVFARHQEASMSYKVPVWSLRAMNQKARSGKLTRATSSAPPLLSRALASSPAVAAGRTSQRDASLQHGG